MLQKLISNIFPAKTKIWVDTIVSIEDKYYLGLFLKKNGISMWEVWEADYSTVQNLKETTFITYKQYTGIGVKSHLLLETDEPVEYSYKMKMEYNTLKLRSLHWAINW